MPKKVEVKQPPPQVSFDVVCAECGCDVFLPLIKMRADRSFSGNRLRIEWPSREGSDDFARLACPQCGSVQTVKADGTVTKSSYRLYGAPKGK